MVNIFCKKCRSWRDGFQFKQCPICAEREKPRTPGSFIVPQDKFPPYPVTAEEGEL